MHVTSIAHVAGFTQYKSLKLDTHALSEDTRKRSQTEKWSTATPSTSNQDATRNAMQETGDEFRLESVSEATKLVLLDDSPAGADGPGSVAFSHDLYADILRDVMLCNRPGICVGFFARWGQGKSTVINLLKSALSSKATVAAFNAYQARGDSVRRQMLLAILNQIDPDK